MSLFKNPLKELGAYEEIEKAISDKNAPIQITDLSQMAKVHLISELLNEKKAWKLVITYDEARAGSLYEDMKCFYKNIYLYPAKDLLFFAADIRGYRISQERMRVWKAISDTEGGIVVTTIDALMDKLESYESFKSNILHINENDSIDLTALSKKLSQMGYERCDKVALPGQFSLRGGIIDIYSLTDSFPIRLELWGDTIDSMRSFDVDSQRSIDSIKDVYIYPAREIEVGGSDTFLRYFDYNNTLIFIDEVHKTYDRALVIEEEFREGMAERLNIGQIDKDEVPSLIKADDIFEELNIPITVCVSELNSYIENIKFKQSFEIKSRQITGYKNNFEKLINDLKKFKKEKYQVVLATASLTRANRLADELKDYGILSYCSGEMNVELVGGQVLVLNSNIHTGVEYPDLKFILIAESDIFSGSSKAKKKAKKGAGGIASLLELNVGDYVVHENQGLGIYRGIEKIERDDIVKDYIKIEYAGGDNFYLPATRLDAIQKYAAGEVKVARLSKIGGNEWHNTKSRVKKAVKDIAKELVELYAGRLNAKGYVYGEDTIWQKEFEELFPFDETDDQIRAIQDIKEDMQSSKIMDRLICGDVGYGKTEIAIRAIFKAVTESRQVIYLVPTTILAQQHYKNFIKRMENFPVRIDLLCRFRSPSEQKKTLEDFKKGLVDVIIGTHRVLSKDIEPKNLGLVVIDEEQRFGVKHKEKLKKLKENVDVITLTATPIPRTLHMSLAGIRDLSIIDEAPMDRQAIQTYVMEYQDIIVKEAIKRELARGGQVYYVYNRVNDIEQIAMHIKNILPDIRLSFAHGQMRENELERIMFDFMDGKIDVLVSTTIIETGLDIPNANTVIIHDADRLGLSQLYQLRGRVGRSDRTAYAFLLYKRGKLLSEEAAKRLKAIREFTELGSGIKIAMKDLEIRGAGNVLGADQHGHMQAVGYDLYCKLLNNAIKALRGEKKELDFDTVVDADIDAYIPSNYIENEEQKLDIYKRIASLETDEEYMDIQDELIDRFGEIKKEVENLLTISKIRNMAHQIFITEITIRKQEAKIIMYKAADIAVENIPHLLELYPDKLFINTKDNVEFVYKEKKKQLNCDVVIKAVISILGNMQGFLKVKELDKS